MAITATISGGDVQLTGNPVWVQCTGGSAPAGSSEYKILLKIISQDGKLYGAPFIDAIAPDAGGEAWFDISGYVDQPVDAQFEFPVANPVVSYATQAFNIQVQTGERYIDENGDLQETWGATSSVFQMLKGGLNPRQISAMNDAGTNYFETYLQNGLFLTPRPQGNFVHPTQPVKLWFMVTAGVSTTFNVKGYYDDETTDSYSSAVNLSTDSLYEFNCNPADLGLTLEPSGKKMTHFDVWLGAEGAEISDVRRFHFNWEYCERPYFLLFANSLGGVDDVFMGGAVKEGIKVDGNVVYKPQERSASVFERTLITPNRSGQTYWQLNSGYKSSTEMLFLRDMLVAKQVWLLDPNLSVSNYRIVPVTIESSSAELVDRSKDLYEVTIEVAEAHKSKFTNDNRLT